MLKSILNTEPGMGVFHLSLFHSLSVFTLFSPLDFSHRIHSGGKFQLRQQDCSGWLREQEHMAPMSVPLPARRTDRCRGRMWRRLFFFEAGGACLVHVGAH